MTDGRSRADGARVPFGWVDREPLLELDVPTTEFERRVAGVQELVGRARLDALVVWGGPGAESDVRYLSGFASWSGDSVVLVPRTGEPVLVTAAIFHGEPLHSNIQMSWLRDVRPVARGQSGDPAGALAGRAADVLEAWRVRAGRIGVAPPERVPAGVERALRRNLPGAELVDGSGPLRAMRRIKSPAEVEVVRRLAAATSAGMDAGLAAVRPGATESDVAAAVHAGCIAAGAERMYDYGCLTSAGRRSFMKNVWPRPDKRIGEDELVVIDVAAKLGGFGSDMSRNAVAGQAAEGTRRLLETCLAAQEAGLARTAPGVPVSEVLAVMRRTVAGEGFAAWDWSTAHGFGLDMVEEPYFGPGHDEPLEVGMCFYIEPLIIPTDVGTVCIEDMVLVTDGGCEQLSSSVKRTW
ncbi:MAG: hypothetical protein AVDCRST_MAG79-1701 [uncultured Thermoleophilia bacterium]|uniref:Peptidase M24 domain-containing protein n=1 Tax=uncultured Thermoleophilia bacterium TaxID=1497501 RepID=A0A6J4U5M4_9ACTN|nr:MAG: hypothetical protein AVDCRST_MAG79-1701 [uncultured Thermoleophilia bacterium]